MNTILEGGHFPEHLYIRDQEYYSKLSTDGYANFVNVTAPEVTAKNYGVFKNCSILTIQTDNYCVLEEGSYGKVTAVGFLNASALKADQLSSGLNMVIRNSQVESAANKHHMEINKSYVERAQARTLFTQNATLMNAEAFLIKLENTDVLCCVKAEVVRAKNCQTFESIEAKHVHILGLDKIAHLKADFADLEKLSKADNVEMREGKIVNSRVENLHLLSDKVKIIDCFIQKLFITIPENGVKPKINPVGGLIEEIRYVKLGEELSQEIILGPARCSLQINGKEYSGIQLPTLGQKEPEDVEEAKPKEEDFHEFEDPITLELMANPYSTPTKQTYDKTTIDRFAKDGRMKCLLTLKEFLVEECKPNTELKKRIEAWKASHPD